MPQQCLLSYESVGSVKSFSKLFCHQLCEIWPQPIFCAF